jgi:WD40 repeat protein
LTALGIAASLVDVDGLGRVAASCALAIAGCGVEDLPDCRIESKAACENCAPGALMAESTYRGGATFYMGGVAVDACGSALVAGSIAPIESAEDRTAWLAKYAGDGSRVWVELPELGRGDGANGIASDGHSSYIAAHSTSFANGYVDTDQDSVLLKYDADGHEVWRRITDDGAEGSVLDVTVLPSGDVLAGGRGSDDAGRFAWLRRYTPEGDLVFEVLDPGSSLLTHVVASQAGPYAFVVKASGYMADSEWIVVLDEENRELWRWEAPAAGVRDLAFTPDDELVVLLGGDEPLRAFDLDGNPTWTATETQFAGGESYSIGVPSLIAIASSGDIFLSRKVTIDGDEVAAAVMCYSASGVSKWQWVFDRPGHEPLSSIALGDDDEIVLGATIDWGDIVGHPDHDPWIGRLAR